MTEPVGIILPVYNAGAPLRIAIESIQKQTYTAFKFYILDDCSRDDSRKVIEDVARGDPRIIPIFHEKNRGLSRSLNELLERAEHPILIRMDQDDEALPMRVEKQLSFLTENPGVAVAGSFVYHMGKTAQLDKLVRLPSSHDAIVKVLPQYNCLYHPAVAFRRSTVQEIGGYRGEFKNAEDYDLWLRVSEKAKLANIEEPLLRYRFSVSGMTLSKKWEQYFYVKLAQLSYEDPLCPLDQLIAETTEVMERENRAVFMRYVYNGTIKELVELGHTIDAYKLAWKSMHEHGAVESVERILGITKRRLTWRLGRRHLIPNQISSP